MAYHLYLILSFLQLSRGLALLISVDGWVDKTMNIGREGMFALIGRAFKRWRLDVDATLPKDLEERGVDDREALPNYHYRDDALLVYEAMEKYVRQVVEAHYCKLDVVEP